MDLPGYGVLKMMDLILKRIDDSFVNQGIAQVSAVGVLELPPFDAPSPAVAFVRVEEEL